MVPTERRVTSRVGGRPGLLKGILEGVVIASKTRDRTDGSLCPRRCRGG